MILVVLIGFVFVTNNIDTKAEDFDNTHWLEKDNKVYLALGDIQEMGGNQVIDGIEFYDGNPDILFGLFSDINVTKPDMDGLTNLYFQKYDDQGNTYEEPILLGSYADIGAYDIMVEKEDTDLLLVYGQYFNLQVDVGVPYIWTLYFEKVDGEPVLTGDSAFVTNVDSPMSVEDIQSHISAIDETDGDLTSQIVIKSDNYTANKHKVGEWHLIFGVSDSSANEVELDVTVLVRDVTNPEISGTNTYNQSMTTLIDVNTTIKNALTVNDNYDSNLSITVDRDNYTASYNIVGSYLVTYKSIDNSGNEDLYDVTINVIDDVAPTFSGITTIVKNNNETLSVADIQAQLTANDNNDGNITSNISVKADGYTGNGHVVGSYVITFEVKDSANNITTYNVTVQVMDNIPPVFFVDNYFITVSESIVLTNQDIIDLLTATEQIVVNTQTQVMLLSNEYLGNESTIGMYAVSYKVSSTDGNESTVSTIVNVVADDTSDNVTLDPVPEVKLNAWQQFWNWVLHILEMFWNWLTGLFS